MKAKKNMSVGMKISLQLIAVLAVVLVATSAYIIFSTVNESNTQQNESMAALSESNALKAQAVLNSSYRKAETLVSALEGYEGVTPESRRAFYNAVMKSMIENDKSILGVWTCWKPNVFDGLDDQYKNTSQSDASGRFIPYWVWVDGSVQTMPLVDYETPGAGDYYLLARDSGNATILEPYVYEISGKQVLLTSLAIPIKDKDGNVLGVAGVDMTLESLQNTAFDKGSYKNSYVYLVSNGGVVVIYPNSAVLGKSMTDVPEIKLTDEVSSAIKTGGSLTLNGGISALTKKPARIIYSPIVIGDSKTPWSTALVCDMDEINAPVTSLSYSLVIAFTLCLLIASVCMFFLIRSLVGKPVKSLMEFARDLATGRMDSRIKVGKMDEIGMLANTLDKDVRQAFLQIRNAREVEEKQRNYQAAQVGSLVVNLEKIAKGDLNCDLSVAPADTDTEELNAMYTTIAGNLRSSIDAIREMSEDVNRLADAAVEGELSARADSSKHKGDFKKIVEGVNRTLDAVIKPVNEAAAVLKELAKGNLGVKVTGEYKGDHAAIKDALNGTIDALKGYIKDISEVLAEIASGNLNAGIYGEYRGDFQQIKQSINEIVDSLNGIFGDINVSAEQVASGTTQVAAGSQALSQGATEQASAIEQLTASLAEIANQTKQNAMDANRASNLAVSAKDSASAGNARMKELQAAMSGINDASQNISKIIKVIDDIAFQTNLLALNAAVEAARAGQHGKGFAVVAEEVRSLAARSAAAAKETTEMIEESIKKVKAGTRIANETEHALNEIVGGVEEASQLIGGIAQASSEQATAVAQVNRGVEQVSQVTQTNSATAEQSAAASEELSSQAEILKEMVGRFSLRGQALAGGQKASFQPVAGAKALPGAKPQGKPKISLNGREFGKY